MIVKLARWHMENNLEFGFFQHLLKAGCQTLFFLHTFLRFSSLFDRLMLILYPALKDWTCLYIASEFTWHFLFA